MADSPARSELRDRIDRLEEAYELFLAYAAQGLEGDSGSKAGGELRRQLDRAAGALDGLADTLRALVRAEGLEPEDALGAFADVVERDAGAAGAAVRLVASRPSVSSQLVDNLNASIHLRAVLTDLFLLDELLGLEVPRSTGAGEGAPG